MRVSIDSRTTQPGDYFIPVKGPNFDGRDYIGDALSKGARLLDIDLTTFSKSYRKKLKCAVIGITGSAGKTTVKDMLHSILSQKFNVVSTKENQNNEIGVPLTLLSADDTTDVLIVEMAMRNKGDMAHLTRLVRPTHIVMTGIGLTHASEFKTAKDIAKAKGEIFQKPLAWEKEQRNAYINYSSRYPDFLSKLAEKKGYKIFPFEGQDLPDQNIQLCYMIGRHFGLENEDIQKGLEHYVPSSHRLIHVPHPSLTIIDDTYNSNPDGVVYALQTLKRYEGRKIVVLADMLELGEFSEKEHAALVEPLVDAGVSAVMTFGEESKAIQSEDISVMHFDTKEDLHKMLSMELKQDDVVLVKGSRGMKMEETVEYIRQHVI